MKDDYCLPFAMTAWEVKLREAFYTNPPTVDMSHFYIQTAFEISIKVNEHFLSRLWF